MLLVSRIRTIRRRAKLIQIIAAVSALIVTPVITVLLAALWITPIVGGFDFSVPGIFLTFRDFFRRLYSGHALRPITLRSISGARF